MVSSRRDTLFRLFSDWVEQEFSCAFEQLASTGLLLSTALVAYGKLLFYRGEPKYKFSETVNATGDRFRHLKPFFGSAWSILSRWEEEEPSERSMILPESLFKAGNAVALAWSWPIFVAGLLLGFHGLLRPGGFLHLRRRDLLLPRDLLIDVAVAFVRILGSKTRRLIQRQHARISDITAVRFLDAVFGSWECNSLLFNCSPYMFRRRWDAVFKHSHVPTSEKDGGITPKSLRGSGATWLYQRTEEVGKIQWRGRWQQRRTLEYYLQDVAGQVLLTHLTESQRRTVMSLAALSQSLVMHTIEASCTAQL